MARSLRTALPPRNSEVIAIPSRLTSSADRARREASRLRTPAHGCRPSGQCRDGMTWGLIIGDLATSPLDIERCGRYGPAVCELGYQHLA